MDTKNSKGYKKEDYLTALQFATKCFGAENAGKEKTNVEKAMRTARLRHATIKINTVSREIIISTKGRLHVRPEPEAHQKLQDIIKEIKGQQK